MLAGEGIAAPDKSGGISSFDSVMPTSFRTRW
jgi:hypothetical protein